MTHEFESLLTWIESHTPEGREFMLKILASFPGGEVLEFDDVPQLGWAELTALFEYYRALDNAETHRRNLKEMLANT